MALSGAGSPGRSGSSIHIAAVYSLLGGGADSSFKNYFFTGAHLADKINDKDSKLPGRAQTDPR